MKFCAVLTTLCLGLTSTTWAQLAPIHHRLPAQLPANNRELFDEAMQLFDASYDPTAHLIRRPSAAHGTGTRYMVRESSWYALALLMRDQVGDRPADRDRAVEVLRTVLDQQYLDPAVKWFGTFKRSPEEPGPQPGQLAFTSYDPNWRHFIGTTLEAILIEYPDRLPADLRERMYRSIDTAVQGEIHDGRLVPSYSNIALMFGALWDFAAVHDHNADWQQRSASWTAEVFRLFGRYDAFDEYNAPTYYGVDLYGLALWREYGSNVAMREHARTMESALWNDIALFYQPELRNICGPYDRAYGMDMSSYVTPTGVYMRSFLPAERAPLPEHPTLSTFQVADLWFAPQVALLGTGVPASALAQLQTFKGPHQVIRPIDGQRAATAWVGSSAIWGGAFSGRTRDTGRTQAHPVTAQWRMPSGEIGWFVLTRSRNLDAVADSNGITVAVDAGPVFIRLYTGPQHATASASAWQLAGLTVAVHTDATGFASAPDPTCDNCTEVTYQNVHWMRLDLSPYPSGVPAETATH